MADWPTISVNFRAVTGGVECTASTKYGKVSLSVSEIGANEDDAQVKARRALRAKVAQRKSFE